MRTQFVRLDKVFWGKWLRTFDSTNGSCEWRVEGKPFGCARNDSDVCRAWNDQVQYRIHRERTFGIEQLMGSDVLCLYVGFGGVLFAGFERQRFGELNGNAAQKAIYVINPTDMG